MALSFLYSSDRIQSRYLRAQLVAALATGIDFTVTLTLKELFGFYYVVAVATGACFGAVTAFLLNRNWVFAAAHGKAAAQAIRFLAALAGSAFLNTTGTYWVTETFHCHYLLSKIAVAVLIGSTYSYFVLKSFVFNHDAKK